jgi:hypothetical protein
MLKLNSVKFLQTAASRIATPRAHCRGLIMNNSPIRWTIVFGTQQTMFCGATRAFHVE